MQWPLLLCSTGSRAQAQQLWHIHLVSPRYVGENVLDQGSHPCPGSGSQILNHWTTRKVPTLCFNKIASDSDQIAEALESQQSYSWETRGQD